MFQVSFATWAWEYVYLGLMGHGYVFWWHSCLYLVIASCHKVGDGFQYVGTAHVLNHLFQTTEKQGCGVWCWAGGGEARCK